MALIERIINKKANIDKEYCKTHKKNSDTDDLPSIKLVRQSITSIFRDNKRKATILPTLHSICDATESEIAGANRETIDSSGFSTNSNSVNKINTIDSTKRKHAQKNTVALSGIHQSKPRRSEIRKSIQSVNHKINQSKSVLQKNVSKAAVAAGSSSDSNHRKLENPGKTSAEKFQCKVCEKSFLLKTTLVAHQKIHTDKNSNCPHCQRTFEKPIALSKHLRENCTKIPLAAKKKMLAKDEQLAELNQTMQRSTDLQLKNSKSRNLHLRTPITGIYQTPKKAIKCIHCGDKFLDVVLFATHAELHAND